MTDQPTCLPTLETDRLILRPMEPDDAVPLQKYDKDPDMSTFLPVMPFAYDEKWIAGHQKSFADRERAIFAITLKPDQQAIGIALLIYDKKFKHVGELGYWVARHLWGQGIATETSMKLLDWGFKELKLEVIIAMCPPDHLGSIRVMQKLGMTYEGRLQKRMKKDNGFKDMVQYSIAREEHLERVKKVLA